MLNIILYEFLSFILGLVQPYNKSNTQLLKNRHIILRSKTPILISNIEWATKSDKLLWQNPVQIPILHLLIMLVFLHVKRVVVVPAEGDCEVQTLQAVLYCAFVGAGAHGSVSEGDELRVVGFECLPCFIG